MSGPASRTVLSDMTNSQLTSGGHSVNSSLEEMDCDTKVNAEVNEINFLDNCSQRFFSWCGFDFDLYTLDVYL